MTKKNLFKSIGMALLVLVLITPLACKAPAEKLRAEFEVISLDIVPAEVKVGEPVTVTAKIANIGKVQGTYTAILMVNDAEVERKNVTILPEDAQIVTFKLIKDIAGTYTVKVAGLTKILVVKKLIAKEIELKYDDGSARDALSSGGGYLVDFSPSAASFTIKKIKLLGGVFGTGWEENKFEVEIWDKDRRVLYRETYPVTRFPVGGLAWVDVEIPDIKITDKFYVHVWTGTGRLRGIHLGADDSVINEHSTLTVRTAEGGTLIRIDWPYSSHYWFGDKSKVNWMIRVVGEALVTE